GHGGTGRPAGTASPRRGWSIGCLHDTATALAESCNFELEKTEATTGFEPAIAVLQTTPSGRFEGDPEFRSARTEARSTAANCCQSPVWLSVWLSHRVPVEALAVMTSAVRVGLAPLRRALRRPFLSCGNRAGERWDKHRKPAVRRF